MIYTRFGTPVEIIAVRCTFDGELTELTGQREDKTTIVADVNQFKADNGIKEIYETVQSLIDIETNQTIERV